VRSFAVLCAVAAAAVAVAGCTGGGTAARSSSASHSSTGSRSSGSRPNPPSSAPSSTPTTLRPTPTGSLARVRVSTAIGDPVTADLCAAIGLEALRGLGSGLTPTFDARQDPPGCAVTLSTGAGTPVLGLSVFADAGKPRTATGRTKRTESGHTVYAYPFNPGTGQCERDIEGQGVLLVVGSFRAGSTAVDRTTACGGADGMTARLAQAIDTGDVSRLQFADPTVSRLNACGVAGKAAITSLPDFAGGTLHGLSFGVACQLRRPGVNLFVNFAISAVRRPAKSTPASVGTHVLYATALTNAFCSYVSTQGRTSDGQFEQIAVSATYIGAGTAPAQLCDQTKTAAGRYLDAAGLP
jgi:hypothetical protein